MVLQQNQEQSSGDNSINVQAQSLQTLQIHKHGMSYDETKQIALDVFKAELEKYKGEAIGIASDRANSITIKLLERIRLENPELLQSAKNPDFQDALFTVQKEYAKSGDKDLGDILIDILIERAKSRNRSLIQIVLNESLAVAPKLTAEEISALTILYIFRHTYYTKMINLDSLPEYFNVKIAPFIDLLPESYAHYQHIEYASCGTLQITSLSFVSRFKDNYSGLFSRGFSSEQIEKYNHLEMQNLFIPCLHNSRLFQLNALNNDVFIQKAKDNQIPDDIQKELLALHKESLFDEKESEEILCINNPIARKMLDVWIKTPLNRMTLTSVGIAIGHANYRRVTGENPNLGIWIT